MIFFPACLRGEIYHWPWEDVGHLKVTAVDVILNDLVMKSICFLFSWNGSTSLITSSKPVWKSVVKPLLGSFKIGNRWIAKCINFWLHVKIWHTFTHSQILLLSDYLIHIEYMYIYMQYSTNKNSLEKNRPRILFFWYQWSLMYNIFIPFILLYNDNHKDLFIHLLYL